MVCVQKEGRFKVAIQTYTEQLERVQATIQKIEESAQEYNIADRALKYPELASLYKREKYLRGMVARYETTGAGKKRRIRRGVI